MVKNCFTLNFPIKPYEYKMFKIKFIKQVIFKDQSNIIRKVYNVDDVIESTFDAGHYYVTTMGGIYKDEAVIVESTDQVD